MSVPNDTLVDLLRRRAEDRGGARAFTFLAGYRTEAAHLSFAELDRKARALGAALREDGLGGSRLLLLFPSGLEFVVAFFGALYAGAVPVPTYPPDPVRLQRTLPRMLAVVADSDVSAILTTRPAIDMGRALAMQIPDLAKLRWVATDEAPDDAAAHWQHPDVSPGDLALLQYTSGSTARPQGVMISHRNVLANELMMQIAGDHGDQSTMVSWLPLYHDLGLLGGMIHPLFVGSHGVLMSPLTFLEKPLAWLAAISDYRAAATAAPNFAFDLCVRRVPESERKGLNLSCLRMALMGGEPIRASTLERFEEAFAPHGFSSGAFFPGYGLAEATVAVTSGRLGHRPRVVSVDGAALEGHDVQFGQDERARLLVSNGKPLQGVEVKIVDPASLAECGADQVGEVWVRGPNVASGYWRHPERTARVFDARLAGQDGGDPWLRTGDLGFLDDGELYITGRMKDVIIVNGANYYPEDIEETVFDAHDTIRPGGVVAFAVDDGGEERVVVGCEVRGSKVPAGPELAEWAAQLAGEVRLAVSVRHQLRVHEVLLLEPGTIPKTSSGKVQRHACRDAFLDRRMPSIANA